MRLPLLIFGQVIAIATLALIGVGAVIAAIIVSPALLFFKTINLLKL